MLCPGKGRLSGRASGAGARVAPRWLLLSQWPSLGLIYNTRSSDSRLMFTSGGDVGLRGRARQISLVSLFNLACLQNQACALPLLIEL